METTYNFKAIPGEENYLISNCLNIRNLGIGIKGPFNGVIMNPMHIFDKEDFIKLSKIYAEENGMPMIYMAEYNTQGDCNICVSPAPDMEYEFIMRVTCNYDRYYNGNN
jgi:hypothetical protein